MRKKFFGIVVMAAIAVTAGWNMNQSKNDISLSDIALDNVEALAQGESSNSGPTEVSWWSGRYCKNENSHSCSY